MAIPSLRKSSKTRCSSGATSSGPPESREGRGSLVLTRTLTPSNVIQLGPHSPEASSASKAGKLSSSRSPGNRPPSLSISRVSTSSAPATSSNAHALPLRLSTPERTADLTLASIPSSSSSSPSATSAVAALLTQLQTPERSRSSSRSNSISNTPTTTPEPPSIGPAAQLRPASNQSPVHHLSSSSVHRKCSLEEYITVGPAAVSYAKESTSPTLLRRKPKAEATSLASPLPDDQQASSSAWSSVLDHLSGSAIGQSTQSLCDDHIDANSGEYRKAVITGELCAGTDSGEAMQSLKNLNNRASACSSTGEGTGSGVEGSVPEEARRILAQASTHSRASQQQELAGSHPELNAHPEKALIVNQGEERQMNLHEDTRGPTEDDGPAPEPHHTSRQRGDATSQQPAVSSKEFVHQGQEVEASGVIQETGKITEGAARSKEPAPGEMSRDANGLNSQDTFDAKLTPPRRLTHIERQIKEDSARVSSVTGAGRPGYEVPVQKHPGPRLPINVSVDLHLTLPKKRKAISQLKTKTVEAPKSIRASHSVDYSVLCAKLDISKTGLVGQLVTLSITTLVWCFYQAGLW